MRPFMIVVALSAFAPSALAERTPAGPAAAPARNARPAARPAPPSAPIVQLATIDLSAVPDSCHPLVTQALAPSLAAALSARVSLATCLADKAIASLQLCDCGASIQDVDAAAAPALALLDEAFNVGEPATRVIAAHAKGQLYTGFAVRLVGTLPPVNPGASDAEAALRGMRAQTLEAQLAPWREAAAAAFQRALEIAKAHPELAGNAAVASAVRDSQQKLAAAVTAG
jgi:hypothetical protein